MILANHFHDLLDCLAGQFFNSGTKSAICVGKDFGIQISLAAKDYFSVAIIPETLPQERVVLGVLSDDSAKIANRNGYTFTIYIDVDKIEGPEFKPKSSLILSHEICHFAYYYELFIWLGGTTGIRVQNDFKYHVSDKLIGAVIQEQDITSQTNIDEHNMTELIDTFGSYDKNHFTKGNHSLIDYFSFFNDFFDRLSKL
jgi:hypothetical protein